MVEEAVTGDILVDFDEIDVEIGLSGEREVTDVGRRRGVGIRRLGADLETQEAEHVAFGAAGIILPVGDAVQRDHFRVRVGMHQLNFTPSFIPSSNC